MKNIAKNSAIILFICLLGSCSGNYRFLVNPIPSAALIINPGGAVSGQIWISGDWIWNGSSYYWRDGYWRAPFPNRNWRPGYWQKRKNGYYWKPGQQVR